MVTNNLCYINFSIILITASMSQALSLYTLGYKMEDRRNVFQFPTGPEIFLYFKPSTLALGLNHPPARWVEAARM